MTGDLWRYEPIRRKLSRVLGELGKGRGGGGGGQERALFWGEVQAAPGTKNDGHNPSVCRVVEKRESCRNQGQDIRKSFSNKRSEKVRKANWGSLGDGARSEGTIKKGVFWRKGGSGGGGNSACAREIRGGGGEELMLR